MTTMTTRVFISYTHDSETHKTAVAALADRLRADGVDCRIDQDEESPRQGWPQWMLDQVEASSFVIAVCTEAYLRRVTGREDPQKGRGAAWEGLVIKQEVYEAVSNTKFVPIILSASDVSHIPIFLRPATYYDLSQTTGYEHLYRRLTNQPRRIPGPLGDIHELPPEPGATAPSTAASAVTDDHERRIAAIEEAWYAYGPEIVAWISERRNVQTPEPQVGAGFEIDILQLSLRDLLAWNHAHDFTARITLPDEVRAQYITIAEQLFFRPEIDERDGVQAIALLLLAGEYEKAGTLFLVSLQQLMDHEHPGGLSVADLFANQRLPEGISRHLRILIRSFQTTTLARQRKTTDHATTELDELVGAAESTDAAAVMGAALYEAHRSGTVAPSRALRYLQVAARLRPTATGYQAQPLPPSIDDVWAISLRLTASGVTTVDTLDYWLDTLDRVPAHSRAMVLDDEMECVTLASQFWLLESYKPAEAQVWEPVEKILIRLERWAERRRSWLLFSGARRSRIVVVGEYLHELNRAVALGSELPAKVNDDSRCRFLIAETVASQYLFAGDVTNAAKNFNDALPFAQIDSTQRSYALLRASWALGDSGDATTSLAYAEAAVIAVRANRYRVSTDETIAFAELGIARWLHGDIGAAFDAWDVSARNILGADLTDPRWQGLFSIFHYASGYLATLAYKGKPPTEGRDGPPPRPPRRGVFLVELADQASVYKPQSRAGLAMAMLAFAEGTGHPNRAASWAIQALAYARDDGDDDDRRALLFQTLPYILADKRYLDAIDAVGTITRNASEIVPGTDANALAVSFFTLPAILDIGRGLLRDPPATALRSAEHLIAACLVATSSPDDLWKQAAEVFDLAFTSEVEPVIRRTRLEAIMRTASEVPEAPTLPLAIVAISFVPTVTLRDRARSHRMALSAYALRFRSFQSLWKLLVVPFFGDYWNDAFAASRFAFRSPSAVEQALLRAADVPEPDQPQAIMDAIWDGLR